MQESGRCGDSVCAQVTVVGVSCDAACHSIACMFSCKLALARFHNVYMGSRMFTRKDSTVSTKESTHRGTVTGHTHIFRHGNRRILSTHTQTCARTDTHILQSCYMYPHATRGNRSRRSLVAGIQCRPTFKFFDTVTNAQIPNHRVFRRDRKGRESVSSLTCILSTHTHIHTHCVCGTHTHKL